ncbi:MAG TPA: hypothetical protein VF190_08585 [Rhodothermales bacterium]
MHGDDLVSRCLAVPDEDLNRSWTQLRDSLAERFGPNLGIEGILFLIGIQESGLGYEPRLRKERKQDLIMLGTHHALETLGIYRRVDAEGDESGWRREVGVPRLPIDDQEKLLRIGIIRYFAARDGSVQSVDIPST